MEPEWCGTLLDGLAEAVVVADAEMRVRHLNAAAERALGVERGQAAGLPLGDLLPAEPDGTPGTAGSWRWERCGEGWAAYGGDPGAPEGAWLERAAAAHQLAASGELAAGVAHEIGAPLTAIAFAVEYLLQRRVDDEEVRRDLEMILGQTQRIARLSRRLVDLGRPAEPAMGEVDLNRIAEEGFELTRRQLLRMGVEGETELDPRVPPLRGDAEQLQQVLINLVLNAGRAAGAAEGERRVTVRTRATPGAAELRVSDTGPGVAAEDLPRIFLPFFSRAGGTGLGLPLSRSIVHRHGGTLTVESPPGRGATFVASLPLEP